MKRWGGRAASAFFAAVMTIGGLVQPAEAAAVPNGSVVAGTIVPGTPQIDEDLREPWKLISTETGPRKDGRRTHFGEYNTALETSGVRSVAVSAVLGSTAWGTKGRPLCHATNATGAEGFCWSSNDDLDGTWVPQGLTGSGEATDNQTLVPGRRVVATSWSTTSAHTAGRNGMMRVTFADVTNPAEVMYWHALLVTATSGTNFTALDGHADSLTWYKNYLYLSTGAGLAVFDLTKFWVMNGTGTGVGMSGGTASAAGYEFALPQVDYYAHELTSLGSCGSQFHVNADPVKHTPEYQTPPCFAGISLDTSGPVPALVTTEVGEIPDGTFQSFNQVRTVTRWNLNPDTGLLADSPKWKDPAQTPDPGVSRPAQLYTSTVSGAQGIAMNRGRFVIAAACPGYKAGDKDSEIVSCLYHGWPNEPVRLWTRVGVYAENLSYWPATDELWTVNEKSPDSKTPTVGERTVFHIPWPKPLVPLRSLTGLGGDLNGDGVPDMLAIRPQASTGAGVGNGNLVRYDGVAEEPAGVLAGFAPRASIGTNWDSMRLVAGVGDLVKDPVGTPAYPDILAVDNSGNLYRYKGIKDGLGPRELLSTGWSVVRAMTGVGDLTADGLPDLVAIWDDGKPYLYPGTAGGGLATKREIDLGWRS